MSPSLCQAMWSHHTIMAAPRSVASIPIDQKEKLSALATLREISFLVPARPGQGAPF